MQEAEGREGTATAGPTVTVAPPSSAPLPLPEQSALDPASIQAIHRMLSALGMSETAQCFLSETSTGPTGEQSGKDRITKDHSEGQPRNTAAGETEELPSPLAGGAREVTEGEARLQQVKEILHMLVTVSVSQVTDDDPDPEATPSCQHAAPAISRSKIGELVNNCMSSLLARDRVSAQVLEDLQRVRRDENPNPLPGEGKEKGTGGSGWTCTGDDLNVSLVVENIQRYVSYVLLHQFILEQLSELSLRVPEPEATALITDIVAISHQLTNMLVSPIQLATAAQQNEAGLDDTRIKLQRHGATLIDHMQHLSKLVCLCLRSFVPRPSCENPPVPADSFLQECTDEDRAHLVREVFLPLRAQLLLSTLCPLLQIPYQADVIQAKMEVVRSATPQAAGGGSESGGLFALGCLPLPRRTGGSSSSRKNRMTLKSNDRSNRRRGAEFLSAPPLPQGTGTIVKKATLMTDAAYWAVDLAAFAKAARAQRSAGSTGSGSDTGGGTSSSSTGASPLTPPATATATGNDEDSGSPRIVVSVPDLVRPLGLPSLGERVESVPFEPSVVSTTKDGTLIALANVKGDCLVFAQLPSPTTAPTHLSSSSPTSVPTRGKGAGGFEIVAKLIGHHDAVNTLEFLEVGGRVLSPTSAALAGASRGGGGGLDDDAEVLCSSLLLLSAGQDHSCFVYDLSKLEAHRMRLVKGNLPQQAPPQEEGAPQSAPGAVLQIRGTMFQGHSEPVTSACWLVPGPAGSRGRAGRASTAGAIADPHHPRGRRLAAAVSSAPTVSTAFTTAPETTVGETRGPSPTAREHGHHRSSQQQNATQFFSAGEDKFILRWNTESCSIVQRFCVPAVTGMTYSPLVGALLTVDCDSRLCLYDGNCTDDFLYTSSPSIRLSVSGPVPSQPPRRLQWEGEPKIGHQSRGDRDSTGTAIGGPGSRNVGEVSDRDRRQLLPYSSRLEVSFGAGAAGGSDFDLASIALSGGDFAPFLAEGESSDDEGDERSGGTNARMGMRRRWNTSGGGTEGEGTKRRKTRSLIGGRFAAIAAISRTWRDCGDETVREAARLVDGRYYVFLFDVVHAQWIRTFRCDSVTPAPVARRLHRTLREEQEDHRPRQRGRAVDAVDEDEEDDEEAEIVYNDSARERCFCFSPCFAGSRFLYVGSLDDTVLVFDALTGVLKRRLVLPWREEAEPSAVREEQQTKKKKDKTAATVGHKRHRRPYFTNGGSSSTSEEEEEEGAQGRADYSSDDALYLPEFDEEVVSEEEQDQQDAQGEDRKRGREDSPNTAGNDPSATTSAPPLLPPPAPNTTAAQLLSSPSVQAAQRLRLQQRLYFYYQECLKRLPRLSIAAFHGPMESIIFEQFSSTGTGTGTHAKGRGEEKASVGGSVRETNEEDRPLDDNGKEKQSESLVEPDAAGPTGAVGGRKPDLSNPRTIYGVVNCVKPLPLLFLQHQEPNHQEPASASSSDGAKRNQTTPTGTGTGTPGEAVERYGLLAVHDDGRVWLWQ